MLADIIDLLVCPHCTASLSLAEKTARCANGHAFDVARQGYLNLLPGGAHTGTADTAEMVDARARFLAAGHFSAIADGVAHAAASAVPHGGAIVDIGAGTGYYLARACERASLPGIALDISKHAARRAAKAHAAVGAIVADAWDRLPIRDESASAVLDIFSPRNPSEFHRILAPGGTLVVVVPQAAHLAELVSGLSLLKVAPDKVAALDEKLGTRFERVALECIERVMHLSHEEVATVVGMGPSAWHTDTQQLRASIELLAEPVAVTLSVAIVVYRRA